MESQIEHKKAQYTPDMVWQMFAEIGKQMEERSARADKEIQEMRLQQKETDKMIKALSANNGAAEKELQEMRLQQKETDRILKIVSANVDKNVAAIKETNKAINGISDSNGKMAEQAIYNILERDMNFAGIDFDYIDKNKKRKIKSLNLKGEYDIILYNGDTVALIETKHQVREKDVIKLATSQVENFRKLFTEYATYKLVLGIGGVSFDDGVEKEAEDKGIGIIKVIGEKVEYNTDRIRIY